MQITDNGNEIVVTGISNESQYELVACPVDNTGCTMISENYMTKATIRGTKAQLDKYRKAIA